MNGFLVTTERIASAGGAVTEVAGALSAEIATMHSLLGDIRAGWHSTSAAPRFAAAMEGYLAEAATLQEALVGHGSGLTTTAQRFAETEQALADAIGSGR